MNQVFIIFSDGRRIGLSTASNAATARKNAQSAFSRFTASKDGAVCDYERIEAVALQASVRAKVEHPFREIKRQFGLVKVRFRGLAKNTAHVVTLFALSKMWMARKQLLAMTAVVRPKAA